MYLCRLSSIERTQYHRMSEMRDKLVASSSYAQEHTSSFREHQHLQHISDGSATEYLKDDLYSCDLNRKNDGVRDDC